MFKRLLFVPLLGSLVLPTSAQVDPKTHKLCLDARDYLGCVKAMEGSKIEEASTESVNSVENSSRPTVDQKKTGGLQQGEVEVEYGFTYFPQSVRQLKIRERYGRYLFFIGRSQSEYSASSGTFLPGSPGTTSCNTFGSYTSCIPTGGVAPSYIPGQAGGIQKRQYIYHLDCKDLTFDRKGDLANAGGRKHGWMDVYYDPTARAVASKYCGIIETLPLHTEEWQDTIWVKKGEAREINNSGNGRESKARCNKKSMIKTNYGSYCPQDLPPDERSSGRPTNPG